MEDQLNLERWRREETEKAESPKIMLETSRRALHGSVGPAVEATGGVHGGGCGVSASAWQLDLVGGHRVIRCQGDWVYREMCPKRPQLAVWEFLRDPLG